MIKDTDLAWLAGIIDGECGVYISRKQGHRCYSAQIHLENTDKRIVEHYCQIVEALDIKKRVITRVNKNGFRKPYWKESYVCSIQSFDDLLKILYSVFPYLIGKKEQAKKILEWVNYRKRIGIKRDAKGRLARTYNFVDEAYYLLVKKLNNRGKVYG